MTKRIWTFGALAAAALLAASPAVSQSLQIGKNGVRVVPQGQEQTDRDVRMRDRRDSDVRDRDADDRVLAEVSERQAIRIAKGEGLRDVDSVTKTRKSYRIAGVDRRGDDIRVDIDRRSGEVLSVR